jgi:dipeptidyl aminopeptidase/acylaminoacyl peptidase
MSERDGWNHLYLVDVPSGAVRRAVTAGAWVVRAVERVDAARRELVLRVMGIDPAQDPYHEHFVRVGIDGGDPVRLTEGDGTHELLWSPGGEWYVDTWSRVDLAPVRELRRASDGALLEELGRADASALVAEGWTWPERVVAKGRDGATDVWGVLWRPRGTAGDAAPRPVVECIYAGPQDFHVPKSFAPWHGQRAVADAGFVVAMVDGMGTNWRGKRFHDVCWKDLRDSGLPDHVAWLRSAAATRPARHARLPRRLPRGGGRLRLPRQPHGQGLVERAVDGMAGGRELRPQLERGRRRAPAGPAHAGGR